MKLVKFVELLRQESDEQPPLTTNQVCVYLISNDILCDHRGASHDIAFLNAIGLEVLETWAGRSKVYYVEQRSFSVPELKILNDAVQTISFITNKKSVELIDKLFHLGGTNRAEILRSNLVCFNTRKQSDEHIYYNVDTLEDAIPRQKKVCFRYFDIDIDRWWGLPSGGIPLCGGAGLQRG